MLAPVLLGTALVAPLAPAVRPALVETSPAASLLLADIFDDIPQTANPNLARQVEIMKAKQQAAIDAEEKLYAAAAAKEDRVERAAAHVRHLLVAALHLERLVEV